MTDSQRRAAILRFLFTHQIWFLAAGLVLALAALYSPFFHNPLVFDDNTFFFRQSSGEYLKTLFSFALRWPPYASFEWTHALLGTDIVFHRAGNLLLHAATAAMLFAFLYRLFSTVVPQAAPGDWRGLPLRSLWLAFFGTLIFAFHPASVYAVAYLIQRTILMATLFSLLSWYLFLEGILRNRQTLLLASAGAYFFAVLSKEHAIMAPAVALALLILVRVPDRQLLKKVAPTFFLYAAIAAYVVYLVKAGNVIGQAYEPRAHDMLLRLQALDPGFDPKLAYPLSVLTQCTLFFKYLLVWVVPSPDWMAVDMFEGFATRLSSWQYVLGTATFAAYGALAVWLLFKRGMRGLLGFALLCPWLMFATEFSTVRLQETFVIYRSYLWMAGALACLPVVFGKSPAARAAVLLSLLVAVMLPLTWSRLTTFSTPLLLWNDAARLIGGKDSRPGVERVYHNRGLHLLKEGYPEMAIKDLDKAIALYPQMLLAINDRGAAYLTMKDYPRAVADFNRAIALEPMHSKSHLGLALAYEGMGLEPQAQEEYAFLCRQGHSIGCNKTGFGKK